MPDYKHSPLQFAKTFGVANKLLPHQTDAIEGLFRYINHVVELESRSEDCRYRKLRVKELKGGEFLSMRAKRIAKAQKNTGSGLRKEDLSRPINIHLCKDGTISYRDKRKREPIFNGVALPVFSVNTIEQAQHIQVRFGVLAYKPHPTNGMDWYRWTGFGGEYKDLDPVTDRIREFWDEHLNK